MSFLVVFGIFGVGAYMLQIIFSLKQIKNFNETYSKLRKQGKVAIGRRSGKVKAGTIIMFAVNNQGIVLDCAKMQGVTVTARFQNMAEFIGEDIHYLDKFHPIVSQKNKLLITAIEDAREIYLRVEANNYVEEKPVSPIGNLMSQLQFAKLSIQNRFRKDVN